MARGEENLKPFTKENQPVNRKTRKGVPNRATVFKRWLNTKIKIADPDNKKGPKLTVTMYEAAAMGQLDSARKGNTAAWKEIQDSVHGKQADKVEQDITQKVLVEFIKYDGTDTGNDPDQG